MVEKGVPIPPKRSGLANTYRFDQWDVGHSAAYPPEPGRHGEHKASQAARAYGSRNGKKFVTRKTEDGGVRIWRTA